MMQPIRSCPIKKRKINKQATIIIEYTPMWKQWRKHRDKTKHILSKLVFLDDVSTLELINSFLTQCNNLYLHYTVT
jgi:hypothetical protein